MAGIVDTSIVRIRAQSGGVVGAGFVAHGGFVLTCCRIVNIALGRPSDDPGVPVQPVSLDFPYLSPGQQIKAHVIEWQPRQRDGSGDIALLELETPRPADCVSARLAVEPLDTGTSFVAYSWSTSEWQLGQWVPGQVQDKLSNGVLRSAVEFEPSMLARLRGSPVWSDQIGGALGILVGIERKWYGKPQSLIVPASKLLSAFNSHPLRPSVFVSYARADGAEYAEKVGSALQTRHFHSWMDTSSLPGATRWNAEIDQALSGVDAVVVILTPKAIESIQVESEWNRALNLGKPVFPLLFQDCEVPRVLAMLTYMDFRDPALFPARVDSLASQLATVDGTRKGVSEPPKRYEALLTIDTIDDPRSPTVVGQRLSGTIEYFQNRELEIRELGRLLALSSTRIVSVIGPAGMGKTALVSRFLRSLESSRWPDTIDGRLVEGILYLSQRTGGISLERVFVGCAEMLRGERSRAVIEAWTSPQLDLESKIQILMDALRGGLYVLLLDDIEDLLSDSGQFLDPDLRAFWKLMLAGRTDASLLITSREPVAFEIEDAPLDQEILLETGLEALYGIKMLRQSDPSGLYGLKDAPEASLARMVEMVHGVPRALEVFAGIVKDNALLTLDEVTEQFYQHPMTARELIQEGYRRLDENARMVLQGMAIYGRPVTLSAIKFLLEPFILDADISSVVLRLIRVHMVSVVDRNKKLIALHPTDQAYAYSQIP